MSKFPLMFYWPDLQSEICLVRRSHQNIPFLNTSLARGWDYTETKPGSSLVLEWKTFSSVAN